ncbi:MAG: hypothetical protein ACO1O1_10170 [Adhaeribacter sp.]
MDKGFDLDAPQVRQRLVTKTTAVAWQRERQKKPPPGIPREAVGRQVRCLSGAIFYQESILHKQSQALGAGLLPGIKYPENFLIFYNKVFPFVQALDLLFIPAVKRNILQHLRFHS